MRILLAAALSGLILGGLAAYMNLRPTPGAGSGGPIVLQTASGSFSVDITLTFDAAPDSFAVDPSRAAALLVLFHGKELLRATEPVSAGQPVRIEPIEGMLAGENEFFVHAAPSDADALLARGLRVRVLRDDLPIAEQSLWSEPGEVVQGIVVVSVPAYAVKPLDDPRH